VITQNCGISNIKSIVNSDLWLNRFSKITNYTKKYTTLA